MERQDCEGVEINNDESEIVINSKLDHHLPAVSCLIYSRTAAERGGVRTGGRGRGGRGGGGGITQA